MEGSLILRGCGMDFEGLSKKNVLIGARTGIFWSKPNPPNGSLFSLEMRMVDCWRCS
jgi:hypothetical protein